MEDDSDAEDSVDAPSDVEDGSVGTDAPLDTEDADGAADTADTDAAGDRLACLADGDAECPIQDPDSYGECATLLGVVFDGSTCVPASGCACDDADCPAFDSIQECASECGRAGPCRSDDMPLIWGTETLTCGDQNCGDRMTFCVDSDTDPTDQVNQVMPDVQVDCTQDGSTCHLRTPPDDADKCTDGDWCCTERQAYGYGDAELRQLCGMTLLPDTKQATCFHFE